MPERMGMPAPEIRVGDGTYVLYPIELRRRSGDGTRTRNLIINSEVTVSCAPGAGIRPWATPEIKVVPRHCLWKREVAVALRTGRC
jgi:hypothetical protein